MTPTFGGPLVFRYGAGTDLFIGEDELRIGHEPKGYTVVCSKRDGQFPIAYYEVNGETHYFSCRTEAEAKAKELAAKYAPA